MVWIQNAILSLVTAVALSLGGWLGVYLTEDEAPTVAEVIPGSPAEKAGLRPGDVFLELDGDELAGRDDLVAKIGACDAGERVRLLVRRDGGEKLFEVTLGERPEELPVPRAPAAPRAPDRRPPAPAPEPAPAGEAYLGIAVVEIEGGVRLDEVVPESPAARAGLLQGDVLRRIGDRQIGGLEDLDRVVSSLRPGAEVEVLVLRSGREKEIELRVGTQPGRRVMPPEAKPPEPARDAAAPGFGHDLSAAKRAARAAQKPVLLVFGATWCVSSRALEKSFADPAVQKVLQGYERVWLDAEAEPRLADEFGVKELPHLAVLDGDRVARVLTGYQPPEALVEALSRKAGAIAEPPRAVRRLMPVAPPAREPGQAELERVRSDLEALRAELRELRRELEEMRKILRQRQRAR